jgi:hypothetical protein
MRVAVNFSKLILTLVLVMVLTACESVMLNDSADSSNNEVTALCESENISSIDYSEYIGVWLGYAIAVYKTLVIVDVDENELTFFFIDMPNPDNDDITGTASSVFTLPIEDNRVKIVEERVDSSGVAFTNYIILTFHDEHINLLRTINRLADEELREDGGIEWRLQRITEWGVPWSESSPPEYFFKLPPDLPYELPFNP